MNKLWVYRFWRLIHLEKMRILREFKRQEPVAAHRLWSMRTLLGHRKEALLPRDIEL